MAKLNGVNVVVPAQAEKITYNGAEYVKTDAAAKVGDIVRSEVSDCRYLPQGAFYDVVLDTDDGEPIVFDEDGDECSVDSDFTVFAKVEAADAPVQYREVKRKAAIGERIKIVDAGVSFGAYKNGDVLTVKPWEPKLDDFGMVRAEGVGCGIYHREYVVLEPVSDAKPALPTSSALPTSLPSDYVIHDGAVYQKEARKAEKGEKIVFTHGNAKFSAGDVVVVHPNARIEDGGIAYVNGVSGTYGGGRYAVLVPTNTVTLSGPDGTSAEYALEKRPATKGENVVLVTKRVHFVKVGEIVSARSSGIIFANKEQFCDGRKSDTTQSLGSEEYLVLTPKASAQTTAAPTESAATPTDVKAKEGDRIRITNAWGALGKYKNGDEFVVKSVRGDGRVHVAEHDRPIAQDEYDVVTPQYREVKRKATAGERIRIVDAYMTSGKYRDGEEHVVSRLDSDGDVRIDTSKGEAFVLDKEYVVLEPIESAKPSQPDRLKVGDYAKVAQVGHGNYGKIVKVTQNDRFGRYVYQTQLLDGKSADVHTLDQLVRATDAEVAVAKRNGVKVGDYVRVVNDAYAINYKVGSIVKLVEGGKGCDRDGFLAERSDGTIGNVIRPENFEPVTPAEAESAVKPKITVGCTVKLTLKDGERPRHGWGSVKNGDIGEVTRVDSDGLVKVDFPAQSSWSARDYELTVLTAAEAEAVRKQAEEAAKKSAEEAKWIAIGRKVGEIRKGDVVRVTAACSGRNPNGRIGIAKENGTTGSTCVTTVENPTGQACMACVELVAPVESLFNVKEA